MQQKILSYLAPLASSSRMQSILAIVVLLNVFWLLNQSDKPMSNKGLSPLSETELPFCQDVSHLTHGLINHISTLPFSERVSRLYTKPATCVKHCTDRGSQIVKLPADIKCSHGAPCIYVSQWPLHRDIDIYDRDTFKTKGFCLSDEELVCPPPTMLDCEEHGWSEWVLKIYVYDYAYQTKFYNLQSQLERPFSIKGIYEMENPNYIQIVTFFTPSIIQPDGCNVLYCFYEYDSGEIERFQALPGDMSFTFCPKPSRVKEQPIIRLTYDHDFFSEPYRYQIDYPPKLPTVYMTICAIVKKEGKNLQEWIEFHLMMGYERMVLYDNNDEPDPLMEEILKIYQNHVVRVPWTHRHAQTEACTDCVLRFGPSTKWMSIFDVDEFMVPSPQHSNIRDILKAKYEPYPILHATWVTFGSCGEKAKRPGELTMEQCRNLTKSFFVLPKSTFQPEHVAGVQTYGPHFPRLKADLGIRPRSKNVTTDADFMTYHYRFRSWEEFVERRKGDTAARISKWTDSLLKKEWMRSLHFTTQMPDEQNNILRFAEDVRFRISKHPVFWKPDS